MKRAVVLWAVLFAVSAGAQLSAPVPQGSGPGVHSPNSAFPPLPARTDVVPWTVLTSARTRVENNRVLPAFEKAQLALHDKMQRVQGFMMPIEPGEKHTHFLLSSVPLTCPFCVPGGPESMVEVKTKSPVQYTVDPVTVEGRFAVLSDDPYGLFYRITEAVTLK
jgi:hypothetical protein